MAVGLPIPMVGTSKDGAFNDLSVVATEPATTNRRSGAKKQAAMFSVFESIVVCRERVK
jgi:hypothetical protein